MKPAAFALTLLAAAAPLTLASAQERGAAFVIAESNEGFDRLQDAVSAIGDRKATIRIAPGTYRQCAVQEAGDVTFAAETPGTVIFDGVACEGKAALVLRGQAASVEGVIFQNLRVPDGNGAGIRLEKGWLTVTDSLFRHSEEGVLAGDDPAATVRFDRSTFQRLGRCDRGLSCAHSVYIGNYGRLIVTNSRFEAGNGGHYVKGRAAMVDIRDNSFDDSQGHATNYMIDLPAGARGVIAGNEMVQGQDKENHSAFIAVGAEEVLHPSDGLRIEGNSARFAPGVDRNSTFVGDWTGADLAIGQNRIGPGIKIRDSR